MWRSSVAHSAGGRGVAGSNPAIPTRVGCMYPSEISIGLRLAFLLLYPMHHTLKAKIIAICNEKIKKKGLQVGLSFYAFFSNKNTEPALLMEMATWWIQTHQLDHFEKATKIRELLAGEKLSAANYLVVEPVCHIETKSGT